MLQDNICKCNCKQTAVIVNNLRINQQWLEKDNRIQRKAVEECERKIGDLDRSTKLKEKNMKEDVKQLPAPVRHRKKNFFSSPTAFLCLLFS